MPGDTAIYVSYRLLTVDVEIEIFLGDLIIFAAGPDSSQRRIQLCLQSGVVLAQTTTDA